jgi:AhpD family alkylhydroperoxidase
MRDAEPGRGSKDRDREERTVSEQKSAHQPFPEDDNGAAHPQPSSYTMVEPRFREIYFQFYKETYKSSKLDRKTKELVAIGASLAAKCQGCLEGHIKKALKAGASREEISEAIAVAIGVNAAAIVDLTDIAAENTGIRLFDGNGSSGTNDGRR